MMFETPEQDEAALEIAMKALHDVLTAMTISEAYEYVQKALTQIQEDCES